MLRGRPRHAGHRGPPLGAMSSGRPRCECPHSQGQADAAAYGVWLRGVPWRGGRGVRDQGPEYDQNTDSADDPKYIPYQKVTAQLELEPPEEQIPNSLIDLVYAIPTAEYSRMQGPEGSNTGTIKVYSTGRVNTAGTMSKSAAEYKMKKQFKGLSELQSIVSRVATKGTGFKDGKYQMPMKPTIVNKAKELLTLLESLPPRVEKWIVQNPQQAAELPGVSKPTSIRPDLYAGEIRGFDNLTKFFTAVKNKV